MYGFFFIYVCGSVLTFLFCKKKLKCRHGDKIVLEGEGDQIPDAEAGDIIFQIDEAEHDIFKRAGPDLLANIEISLAEALCGFSRVVLKHLDGRGIEITHPKTPGAILRPNQVLKVAGEGMPYKKSDARGDLYLTVDIKFPEDGWATDPAVLDKLRSILPQSSSSSTSIEGAEPVDEVEYDTHANIEEFGANDAQGGSAWVDEDEDDQDGPQCTTQ